MTAPAHRLVTFEDLCAAAGAGDGLAALPDDTTATIRAAQGPVVLTDFAGRDSVAAAMAWMETHDVGLLIPVGDVVPTRFGDWDVYESNWISLREQVAKRFPEVVVAPWFVMSDVDAWRLLNGRYMGELIDAFGFFTPCLGCHLHFYMMRTVLAHVVGANALISGEKELHRNGRRKANQTQQAVDAYATFSDGHGVRQQFPIHKVTSEDEMARLLGDGWQEGERQLPCVNSGNDRGFDGRLKMTPEQIERYMNGFAVPLASQIVEFRRQGLAGKDLEHQADAFVRELLEGLR